MHTSHVWRELVSKWQMDEYECSEENQLSLCRLLLKLGLKDNTKVKAGTSTSHHDIDYGIQQVLQLSEATANRGESNSALVLSPACIVIILFEIFFFWSSIWIDLNTIHWTIFEYNSYCLLIVSLFSPNFIHFTCKWLFI